MIFFGQTDIGFKREINQDAFDCRELDGAQLCVVCDGMGGGKAGNIASKMAVDTICEKIEAGFNSNMKQNSIRNLMATSVNIANNEVFDKSKSDPDFEGMGTTIVAVMIYDGYAHIVHVGDSRAYLYYNGKLDQVTKDHSVVQHLIDIGQITEEIAKNHPDKNIITRAVGVEELVKCDYVDFKLPENSKILICTDGLSNYCDNDFMLSVLKGNETSEKICDALIKKAYDGGASDNITVAISENLA